MMHITHIRQGAAPSHHEVHVAVLLLLLPLLLLLLLLLTLLHLVLGLSALLWSSRCLHVCCQQYNLLLLLPL
jgi:hypothetical protein